MAGRVAGRHFLQIPGPSPVPDPVLRAMDRPVIDHRGPEFGRLGLHVLEAVKTIFKTEGHVVIYAASGTGAWEAAMCNTLSPGDAVLMARGGQFSDLWFDMAGKLGLEVRSIQNDWRRGADAEAIGAALAEDRQHKIKAVCVVHNETSTGCMTHVDAVRRAMDAAGHPALLMADTVSSLASMDYRHDAWGVDVTVAGSQKGLMLPPGLAFTAISDKALHAHKTAKLPRSYWDWTGMLAANATGFFPYTPATNLLHGLSKAIELLHEEGLDNVFARHLRHAEATRRAVRAWGLELQCTEPGEYSPVVTAVRTPDGHSADKLRAIILDRYDMSLGTGLGLLKDRVFRVGHLGDTNDLTILGALAGVEMGLHLAGVPHHEGGAQAAIAYLSGRQ